MMLGVELIEHFYLGLNAVWTLSLLTKSAQNATMNFIFNLLLYYWFIKIILLTNYIILNWNKNIIIFIFLFFLFLNFKLLQTGDRILEVDGENLRNASHERAVEVIRKAGNPVKFLVQSLIGVNCKPTQLTF